LAGVAIAGAAGLAATPHSRAQLDRCTFLHFAASSSQDRASYLQDKYGKDDPRTVRAWDQYSRAFNRADAQGCI
jgi:hypothetical protein